MRRDVQEIFRNTPHGKQVMMFSATLSKEIRPVCKKFMQDVIDLHSLLFNQYSTENHRRPIFMPPYFQRPHKTFLLYKISFYQPLIP